MATMGLAFLLLACASWWLSGVVYGRSGKVVQACGPGGAALSFMGHSLLSLTGHYPLFMLLPAALLIATVLYQLCRLFRPHLLARRVNHRRA